MQTLQRCAQKKSKKKIHLVRKCHYLNLPQIKTNKSISIEELFEYFTLHFTNQFPTVG
jgi:hypothetical protein